MERAAPAMQQGSASLSALGRHRSTTLMSRPSRRRTSRVGQRDRTSRPAILIYARGSGKRCRMCRLDVAFHQAVGVHAGSVLVAARAAAGDDLHSERGVHFATGVRSCRAGKPQLHVPDPPHFLAATGQRERVLGDALRRVGRERMVSVPLKAFSDELRASLLTAPCWRAECLVAHRPAPSPMLPACCRPRRRLRTGLRIGARDGFLSPSRALPRRCDCSPLLCGRPHRPGRGASTARPQVAHSIGPRVRSRATSLSWPPSFTAATS